jgi:hypothetical protein
MLAAITETKPFVLGTRYGPGVEMDKDVRPREARSNLVAFISTSNIFWGEDVGATVDYGVRSHDRFLRHPQEICTP